MQLRGAPRIGRSRSGIKENAPLGTTGMNTKHITDRLERKRLKREARKRRPPKAKRPAGVARGSHKKKVPKMAKGQRKR